MSKRLSRLAAALTLLLLPAVVAGCGGPAEEGAASGGDGSGGKLSLVAYSTPKEAYGQLIPAFNKTAAGKGVSFTQSYGASGDQSRAVAAGLPADIVALSLAPDIDKLVEPGIVDSNWTSQLAKTDGFVTNSVVVLAVRKGNPKNIHSWEDIVKPGVQVVTPNPFTSGGAKWNLMAAYGSQIAQGKSPQEALDFLHKVLANTVVQDKSAREALQTFAGGNGDVLISYENETILARQSGTDIDYVVPDSSLKIENSCAVTKKAGPAAKDWLKFQTSKAGQKAYAETGYRPLTDIDGLEVEGANDPSDPYPAPGTLLTIDGDFGGWGEANGKYFGDGEGENPLGILTEIQSEAGQ